MKEHWCSCYIFHYELSFETLSMFFRSITIHKSGNAVSEEQRICGWNEWSFCPFLSYLIICELTSIGMDEIIVSLDLEQIYFWCFKAKYYLLRIIFVCIKNRFSSLSFICRKYSGEIKLWEQKEFSLQPIHYLHQFVEASPTILAN